MSDTKRYNYDDDNFNLDIFDEKDDSDSEENRISAKSDEIFGKSGFGPAFEKRIKIAQRRADKKDGFISSPDIMDDKRVKNYIYNSGLAALEKEKIDEKYINTLLGKRKSSQENDNPRKKGGSRRRARSRRNTRRRRTRKRTRSTRRSRK